jgi:hypothetical protein
LTVRCLAICTALMFAACHSKSSAKDDAGTRMDAGGPDASCITLGSNPTNDDIINACTNATKVYLSPNLPLLGSNGELPPLPD